MNKINIIETRVRSFIEDIQHPTQKKKLNINDLEFKLRKLQDDYYEMDGYSLFYEAIQSLQDEEQLTPIQNHQYFWVNVKAHNDKWDRLEMMKLSDRFDFSFYERHSEWQPKEEWSRIKNFYAFHQSSGEREIVSL
ncbi:hypothetical protein [Paenibacillus sp. FSL R5-0490]|uniref:hypothetical protein n=1 Tax=Bacillales TaxID=1385 RepID=UPI0025704C33|nr:hypothetical protein [Paenibacillus sp. FSL R5-0490]